MDRFIRLLPMFLIVPIITIMYMTVKNENSLRGIALLCGFSAMSLAAAFYILQTRIRGRMIDPNKYMVTILIWGVAASVIFYFVFNYVHG